MNYNEDGDNYETTETKTGNEQNEEEMAPLQVEVLGYDVSILAQNLCSIIDCKMQTHQMGELHGNLIISIITSWANNLLSQGITTINIAGH